jgi:choline-sulfatase
VRLIVGIVLALVAIGCSRGGDSPTRARAPARNLVLITIDTLRADRVGAYGYTQARTPAIDALAARGARFEHAYAAAPITLTSHASLMSGRYPPVHGARHNGMKLDASVATLADRLRSNGFATGAFVAAFPLDRRFGLAKGFDTYEDRMPRSAQGRLANERPAKAVVDQAVVWLNAHRSSRFFLWVHFFEPHSPYGDPSDRRPVHVRYDDEVAEADRQLGRLMSEIGPDAHQTIVVMTSDHGEAFGEHGEIGHSIFVYDTTLHVPLVIAGPSISRRAIRDPIALVDVPRTVLRLLDVESFESDGVDLSPALAGGLLSRREIYAESFAPLLDFGWSPLRSLRADSFKFISAPKPELYDIAKDPGEGTNLIDQHPDRVAPFEDRVGRISPASLESKTPVDAEARRRLEALGYLSGRSPAILSQRADPKDRRELASRIAQVTSGELMGSTLESTLRSILAEDPNNPQAHLRLGYVLSESHRCKAAETHFRAAIAARMPTADAHLGLAGCYAAERAFDKAAATLREAATIEPENLVVVANQGVMLSDAGHPAAAVPHLQRALALDPDFHEARFNLAIAFARSNRKAEAAAEARELLKRLPSDAPQRPEVERLLAAVR